VADEVLKLSYIHHKPSSVYITLTLNCCVLIIIINFPANKWGRSSSSRYPENQPTMIYGMEYDQINPSRSDPGYLVLDLKKLAQGSLKFHEQQLGSQRRKSKPKAAPKPRQQQPKYNNPGQYQQYYNNNGYQPNYQNDQQQNYQQQNYQPQYAMQG
jgi:hypothetical protein